MLQCHFASDCIEIAAGLFVLREGFGGGGGIVRGRWGEEVWGLIRVVAVVVVGVGMLVVVVGALGFTGGLFIQWMSHFQTLGTWG